MRISGRQLSLTILAAGFLLAAVSIFAVFLLAPNTADVYQPFLLTTFIVALFVGLVCIAWLLRGILRPYNQLISEAERAPVAHSSKPQNEAAFVLETFQSVVAQLQSQQQELERLTAEASQRADSAERFSERIVASMPTGLIAFGLSGHVTVANAPAHALFGEQIKLEGKHFRAIFHDVPAMAEMVDACLRSGQIFRREEIEATSSTQPKRLGATVAPIDPSASGSKGALCLITDITEVTQLREQVALKRNLANLGEMSAGLAHEFKNAMAALHGYAQFLQTVDHNEQTKGAADALLLEVRNLSDMTTAFLNFAKPQPLQLDHVSPSEVLQDCARELKPLYDDRSVELVVETVGDVAQTRADARMLRQALLNLLRNAAEAIPDEDTERRVFAATASETAKGQRWATITIRDTGPGIPPADLQNVFIPFFTTKSSGHGVGLPLAHRIITEHGGMLTVANASQGGAVFTIRLPQ
ncbi:MAG TPA: ATP-binding protein [Pyrinomonadaceae bacterium]|jgi:signal transduction histidine kinase